MFQFLPQFSAYDVAGVVSTLCIVGYGSIIGFKRFYKKKFKKIDKFVAAHNIVHELLTELRYNAGANRATIFCLHNGGESVEGFSMRKFSASHESCRRENSSQITILTNCLCSLFASVLKFVTEENPKIINVDNLQESFAKHFFKAEGVQWFAVLPIENGGLITNFVLVQWQEDPILHENSQKFEATFTNMVASIKVHLTQINSR